MVKTIYEITINEFILFNKTNDYALVTKTDRIKPKDLKYGIDDLMYQVYELFNPEVYASNLEKDRYKLYLWNKIMSLQLLLIKVTFSMQQLSINIKKDKNGIKMLEITELTKEEKKLFKSECKTEYKGTDDNIELLSHRLKFWTDKYTISNQEKQQTDGKSIEEIIPTIEKRLGFAINRDLPLFNLKQYIDTASKIE